jgi:hypothetical protein
MLSNKIKKDLKALVPNSPDLRCAIDGSGRSAVAYHITDQVISKEKKMQRRILVCGILCTLQIMVIILKKDIHKMQ